jgi:hypothetical protein
MTDQEQNDGPDNSDEQQRGIVKRLMRFTRNLKELTEKEQ